MPYYDEIILLRLGLGRWATGKPGPDRGAVRAGPAARPRAKRRRRGWMWRLKALWRRTNRGT